MFKHRNRLIAAAGQSPSRARLLSREVPLQALQGRIRDLPGRKTSPRH